MKRLIFALAGLATVAAVLTAVLTAVPGGVGPLQGTAGASHGTCDPIDLRIALPGIEPPPSKLIVLSGEVVLTVLRGETAAFNNLVGLASPANNDLYFSKDESEGTHFNLGTFASGTELIFRITTPPVAVGGSSGDKTYFTGPGARNPDGLVHANVVQVAENIFWVGWEDLFFGGDKDYDDVFFQVCGDLTAGPTSIEVEKTADFDGRFVSGTISITNEGENPAHVSAIADSLEVHFPLDSAPPPLPQGSVPNWFQVADVPVSAPGPIPVGETVNIDYTFDLCDAVDFAGANAMRNVVAVTLFNRPESAQRDTVVTRSDGFEPALPECP